MIFEHVVTSENEEEIGEQLGRHVVIMTETSWRRLRDFVERARDSAGRMMHWDLNVVLVDMGEQFEVEQESFCGSREEQF